MSTSRLVIVPCTPAVHCIRGAESQQGKIARSARGRGASADLTGAVGRLFRVVCARNYSAPLSGQAGLPAPDAPLELREGQLEHHRAPVRAARLEVDRIEAVEQRSRLVRGDVLVRADRRVARHGGEEVVERVVDRAAALQLGELTGEVDEERGQVDASERGGRALDGERVAAERLDVEPEPAQLGEAPL